MPRPAFLFVSALLALPGCTPPDVAEAIGIYDIDAKATGKSAGLLSSVVESVVKGSTLELKSDMTFVAMNGDVRELEGRWKLSDGKLTLDQTHEKGKPVKDTAVGTLDGGDVTVPTKKAGFPLTLVFHRRR